MSELTKLGHSCVRLSDGDRVLVVDPGVFSDAASALRDADAVLITHEHPDHIDAEAMRGFDRPVFAPASVAGTLENATAVEPGQSFQAAGFDVQVFGGQHALIHPSIPTIANLAYLIDGRVYHPGDSFTVPTVAVQTLLAPIHAPWSKLAEVVDFVVAVRAESVHQIHDGLLNETGLGMVEGQVTRIGGQYGSQFRHLDVGASVSL